MLRLSMRVGVRELRYSPSVWVDSVKIRNQRYSPDERGRDLLIAFAMFYVNQKARMNSCGLFSFIGWKKDLLYKA